MTHRLDFQISVTMVIEKIKFMFSYAKHLKKHSSNLVKPIYDLKTHNKKCLKTQNQPETKNLSKLRYVILGIFKVNKNTHTRTHLV